MNVKLRVLVSIGLLTILGAVFIIGELVNELQHNPEYTASSSAVYLDPGVVFMENWNGAGWLYRMEDSGKVRSMTGSRSVEMDRAEKVGSFDGKIYALYSAVREDKDGSFTVYRIVEYDNDLEMTKISEEYLIEGDWETSSVTADSTNVYISMISNTGDAVSVDSVSIRDLKGPDSLDEEDGSSQKNGKSGEITRENYSTPESILYRERTTERFFVEARYSEEQLYILMDGEDPTGDFAPNANVKYAVDEIDFTPGQNARLHSQMIIRIIGMFIIWLILVILALKLTKDRDRIVYLFSASEVAFFLILFVAFAVIRFQGQKNEIQNNTRFAMMVMQADMKNYSGVDYDSEDFYNSTKYYRLMESLSEVMNEGGENSVFKDVFVMRQSTGLVLADAGGRTGVHASYLYGGEMSALITILNDGDSSTFINFRLDDEELNAVGYSGENPSEDLALVAVCRDRIDSEDFKKNIRSLAILFIAAFVIGSVLLFIALYLQHMDLKHFSAALKGLALGKKKEDVPKKVSRDMRELWRSYGEISQRIEQINYDKYMIFEAYYRFAPKGIEEIMGRDSILDVKNGDVVTVSGSIVLLSVNKDEDFNKKVMGLCNILTNMETYARKNEGILVSRDPSLSSVRFLLLKENGDTVSQIVQTMHGRTVQNLNDFSVLMYKDTLTYGVAGSATQSLTYIDSDLSRDMDAYSEWFRQLGVPLVATERVVNAEDVGEKRFIGCALFEQTGDRVRFYEILDAYSADIRQLMLINREKFENTLELFHSKDFYLARNQFMEILKDCPYDGITRWYIFECEKYMNGEADVRKSDYIQIEQ